MQVCDCVEVSNYFASRVTSPMHFIEMIFNDSWVHKFSINKKIDLEFLN